MRITQRALAVNSLRGLNGNLAAVTKLQNQLTSGKTISTPSDDPTGTNAAIDALVVPGGTLNADTIRTDEQAQAIVQAVDGAGKPLAVICHGPWLLVSAGLAKGRRLTSYPSLADDVRNAGGDWVDEEVVVDGNLITSRKPDDLPAFTDALLTALDSS